MSIRSTQIAMGYVSHTTSQNNCQACVRSALTVAPMPPGRRCDQGGFFVLPRATCRRFETAADPAHAGKVQIGPTDI